MRGMAPAAVVPLVNGLPEPWAVEWGEDRFGLFMSFAVNDVAQRMRWVPPGTFLMGSPESEAGREDDEVQHQVVLQQGFWLGETPVTQALWEAVMDNNPSLFCSPQRPVENVSWHDCRTFIARLNTLVPGLGARLPFETEWEYACRGGTTGATWVGELDIRGANHAPILDAIAWYGGNSGQGFELPNVWNSSGWAEKQYPHTRAGTRPVRGKLQNPLGLYDMLGNVYEWCEDWYGPYDAISLVDPCGPAAGSERIMRGGSWYSDRAAYARAIATAMLRPRCCDRDAATARAIATASTIARTTATANRSLLAPHSKWRCAVVPKGPRAAHAHNPPTQPHRRNSKDQPATAAAGCQIGRQPLEKRASLSPARACPPCSSSTMRRPTSQYVAVMTAFTERATSMSRFAATIA
jgi:formylglycine-generating enzyme required for sulfatase activity